MGKLIYGVSDLNIEIDDRSLAHLQIVIGNKLRRDESFFVSWKDDAARGDGRSSIWMDTAIPMYFKYSGGRAPHINSQWVSQLMLSANSGSGLVFTDEPAADGGTITLFHGHV